jgi:signal transduction histidine kinase
MKLRKTSMALGIFLLGKGVFIYALARYFLWRLDILAYEAGASFISYYASVVTTTAISMMAFAFCMAAVVIIVTKEEMETRKMREQQLAVEIESLAHIDKMKTELMETISHETRTPLAVLASYSGLIAMQLKRQGLGEKFTGSLDKIVSEAKRIAELIGSLQLVTLSEKAVEKRLYLDLSNLITQTGSLYQHIFERRGVKMEIVAEKNLRVFGSPEELTQVLFNLLQNANNHTEEGKVTITGEVKEVGGEPMVMVKISDTGSGIEAKLMSDIYNRGVFGSSGGKGIGLAVCKKIIDAHDGTISIESEEQKGTTVCISLPFSKEVMTDE